MDATVLKEAGKLFLELADLPESRRRAILSERPIARDVYTGLESLLDSAADSQTIARKPWQEESLRDSESDSNPLSTSTSSNGGKKDFASAGGLSKGDRYELRDKVAQGGMGTIWRVWDLPLQRDLAMKVIHRGRPGRGGSPSPSASHVRRFVDEAQITGRLEHPGVVPVHDLALNEEGEVYFTMRLIKGMTFKEVIEKARQGDDGWNLARALHTLLRACETVAYAHSKGVIHRDLKPSNIMVGEFGETYVMDWGLSKVVGERDASELKERARAAAQIASEGDHEELSSDIVAYTIDGEVIGTPQYMPPEQARGELELVGPSADVYAMGAVLYHLLSGHSPFLPPGVKMTPQTLLARVLDGPPHALAQGEHPAELVAICEKAMERERERRYPNMGEMVEDVRAFLERRVVKAYRTGRLIELRQWVIRNKALVAGLAATLILGLIGTGIGLRQAMAQRDEANQSRQRMEVVVSFLSQNLNRLNVRSVGDGMIRDIREEFERGISKQEEDETQRLASIEAFDGMLDHVNGTNLAREVIEGVYLARAVREIEEGFSEDPVIEAELRDSVSRTYSALGAYESAFEHGEHAYGLRRQHLGQNHPKTLISMLRQGRSLIKLGRHDEAESLLREALETHRLVHGDEHRETQACIRALSSSLKLRGELDEAEAFARELLSTRRRLYGDRDKETIGAMNELAVILMEHGQSEEALDKFETVLDARREIYGPDHSSTLLALNNLMATLFKLHELERAESHARALVETYARVQGDEHPDTIMAQNNLGRVLIGLAKFEEAATVLEEANEIAQYALPLRHEVRLKCTSNLVDALLAVDAPEEAEEACRQLLEVRREMGASQRGYLAATLEQLSHCLLGQERFSDAKEAIEECLTIRESIDTNHWLTHRARSVLGACLVGQGDLQSQEEGERLLRTSLQSLLSLESIIPISNRETTLREARERVEDLD